MKLSSSIEPKFNGRRCVRATVSYKKIDGKVTDLNLPSATWPWKDFVDVLPNSYDSVT